MKDDAVEYFNTVTRTLRLFGKNKKGINDRKTLLTKSYLFYGLIIYI